MKTVRDHQEQPVVPTTQAIKQARSSSNPLIGQGIARLLRGLAGPHAPALDRIAFAVVIVCLVIAVIGPWIAPYDPYETVPSQALQAPSGEHLLGTDGVGRDILSRLLAGAPLTILTAMLVMVASAVIGILVASIAALSPRRVDDGIMRVTDIFMSIPNLVMALGVAAVLGPSLASMIVAMTIVTWPATTRITRNVLREVMTSTYVESSKIIGVSRGRLMIRHALPNSLDAVYVFASMEFAGAVIMMSGLAFLGVGAPPPSPDWGSMIAAGQEYITSGWWVALFPGLAITVSAAAFSLFGDSLRRINDPASKGAL